MKALILISILLIFSTNLAFAEETGTSRKIWFEYNCGLGMVE